MPSIRKTDGYVAAKALLQDLCINPDTEGSCRVQIICKLVKCPQILANLTASVFSTLGDMPDIYEMVKLHSGTIFADSYAKAIDQMHCRNRHKNIQAYETNYKKGDLQHHPFIDALH